jgi:hypothetical protein
MVTWCFVEFSVCGICKIIHVGKSNEVEELLDATSFKTLLSMLNGWIHLHSFCTLKVILQNLFHGKVR